MTLTSLYEKVDKTLVQLDFDQLYPGFRKYRFALYNHDEVCLDANLLPYDQRFLANTAISYDGEYIAIWDMGQTMEKVPDIDLLAYCIVHEMFHCFQYENQESRFPDDLKLANYPASLDNYRRKYLENQALAETFVRGDRDCLIRFCELRNARLEDYGDVLLDELKAETIEGMAEFVGLKALKTINAAKYQEITRDYLRKLTDDLALLFDVRRISYYTGTLLCLTLEKLGMPVQNDFHGTSVYQQNLLTTASCRPAANHMSALPELDRQFHERAERRQHIISAHMTDSNYVECQAAICGYDPMNMFRSGNLLYCSHFIFLQPMQNLRPMQNLQAAGEAVKIDGPVLLVLKDGSDREISGYYLKTTALA